MGATEMGAVTFIMRISCWMMVKSSPGSSLITLRMIIMVMMIVKMMVTMMVR